MSRTALSPDQRDALDQLRSELRPGTTVHTILRHVSRSGMSRSISAVVIGKAVWRRTKVYVRAERVTP